jgi:hypothetical protein
MTESASAIAALLKPILCAWVHRDEAKAASSPHVRSDMRVQHVWKSAPDFASLIRATLAGLYCGDGIGRSSIGRNLIGLIAFFRKVPNHKCQKRYETT